MPYTWYMYLETGLLGLVKASFGLILLVLV